ncbi:DUF4157 domain-containing protein [Algoriphagus aestuariicola]|uniref:DUF4157 domain-containing protein n=1 Tax=Algoriphagus aestuariicola TaxID=1852016 RepID=A0ABS3BL93_9BACT|nr:DUF4157 domain-containing protein [Algoriphagus aestuariicola]MBN7800058.1 DUF4157 domain-containing protein [Algoriphagus aestuariicola]
MPLHAAGQPASKTSTKPESIGKQDLANSPFQFEDNRPETAMQLKFGYIANGDPVQKKENKTGLPDALKSGVESLSGYSLDDVKVHYNSGRPAQLQAHAFAQGIDIHIAPGQEKHLPHEAWHVVQQKQGRVKPTMQMKAGVNVNDDSGLEREADVMGVRALKTEKPGSSSNQNKSKPQAFEKGIMPVSQGQFILQRKVIARIRTRKEHQDLPRVISELRIEGRAPTTVAGAQGDHTVAETLINESVKREVMDQQPKVALNNLMVLASLTLPEEGVQELNGDFFSRYWNMMDGMEGEDQNTVIEEMIQRYIELANKREGTAFLRDEELTRGNKGERKAIGGVRELADKLEQGGRVDTSDLAQVASNLAILIDMRYYPEEHDRYKMVVERAVQHAVLSVLPQLGPDHVHFLLARLMSVELGPRDGINSENQNRILKEIMDDLRNL